MRSAFTRSFCLATAVLACAPARAEHRRSEHPIVIPIEIRNGLVVVRVMVNDHAALLVVDTGSGISVLDTAFASSAAISESGLLATAKGTAATSVRLGTARTMQIGDAVMNQVPVASVPLHGLRATIGSDIRGTLGYDLFDQYVVDIDYDARTLTLSEPESFTYAGSGTTLPVTLSNRLPVVSASLVTRRHGSIPARLHVDLGSSGYALRLATSDVRANDLAADTTTVGGILGVGVGGVIHGDLLRFPALSFGGLTIRKPSAALSSETEGAFGLTADVDGAIGAPVWSRMRVIVDYSRSRIILEPRHPLDEPDELSTTGISLVENTMGIRSLRVSYVVAGSAGAEAGALAGDELLGIDPRDVSAMSVAEASAALRSAHAPITVRVKRGDASLDLHLSPRQIF